MNISILDTIVAQKKLEIQQLYREHSIETLRYSVQPGDKHFYPALQKYRATGQPFFILEFKRKSPSEGWINRDTPIEQQIQSYLRAGAGAVSVLTDQTFLAAPTTISEAGSILEHTTTLLLQKDFILDPIQILLARQAGANIILLIAAILSPEKLQELRREAEALGMGVLVEVHDQEELDKVGHLDFPVLGINNRDLKTFRTALNRVNVLAKNAGDRFIISESGIRDFRDLRIARKADGFLIGTSLMQGNAILQPPPSGMLFKACGIRQPEHLCLAAQYLGINFSPLSKRSPGEALLEELDQLKDQPKAPVWSKLVPVFYKNTETEIRQILTRFPFKYVQVYAGDVSPAFLHSLTQKVLLACRMEQDSDLELLEEYAADVDLFILDGARPGSGERISISIPADFPYPFLLAGGMHAGNLEQCLLFENCIGVDIASGIETGGILDPCKADQLRHALMLAGNPA